MRGLFLGLALLLASLSPETMHADEGPLALPVICYHRFGKEDGIDKLKISAERFAEELAWLRAEGYESVTLEQAADLLEGKTGSLPQRPILLTIDDGYRSGWITAGPVLERYGFKAVYFLVGNQVEAASNFLNWRDVRELLAAGHQVGSHTLRHSNLAKPLADEGQQDYSERLETEIVGSRSMLERELGIGINALAYPFGAFNPTVENMAGVSGYRAVFTATSGVNLAGDGTLRIRRFVIMGAPTLESFKRKVVEGRLGASVDGIADGRGYYHRDLPRELTIHMPASWEGLVPRVELQGKRIPLVRGAAAGTWTVALGPDLPARFYFLKVEAGHSPAIKRDRFLFQVYKNSWKGWFLGEGSHVNAR